MLLISGISAGRPVSYMTDGPNPRLMYAVSAPEPGQPSSSLNGSTFDNCRQITPNFNFHWAVRDGMFKAAHEGFAPENFYFAFAAVTNPAPSGNQMVGADAIVTYFNVRTNEAFATDYRISGVSECSGGNGVCPDEIAGGVNDVFNVSGYHQDGIHVVSYVRPLRTMDVGGQDLEITTNAQNFLFAQGEMSDDTGYPTNHGPNQRGIVELSLGRASSLCNQLQPNMGDDGSNDGRVRRGAASTLSTGLGALMTGLAVAYALL